MGDSLERRERERCQKGVDLELEPGSLGLNILP